jgi:hypothetical protein
VTCGNSEQNAVFVHQTDSAKFPTSGVSTTPVFNRAKYYALHGRDKGIVVQIDRELLCPMHVREFPPKSTISTPVVPEDQEVILVGSDNGPLPDALIFRVHEVTT